MAAAEGKSPSHVRFNVTTTLGKSDTTLVEDYKYFVAAHYPIVMEHGATSGEVLQLQTAEGEDVKFLSTYVFPSQAVLDTYLKEAGPKIVAAMEKHLGGRPVSSEVAIGNCVIASSGGDVGRICLIL